jgi:MFS family permease
MGMLLAMLVRIGENTAFYMLTTFLIVYATQMLKMEKNPVLNAITIASIFQIAGSIAAGALSDRVGRRPLILSSALSRGATDLVFGLSKFRPVELRVVQSCEQVFFFLQA